MPKKTVNREVHRELKPKLFQVARLFYLSLTHESRPPVHQNASTPCPDFRASRLPPGTAPSCAPLRRQGVRLGMVVNDMAEVNVDAKLVRDDPSTLGDGADTVELQNGCICW